MEQVMFTRYMIEEKQPDDGQTCLIGFNGGLKTACYLKETNEFLVIDRYYSAILIGWWAPLDFEPLEQTVTAAQQRQAIIDKATIGYVAAMCANRNLNIPAATAVTDAIVLAKLTADALGYAELPTKGIENV